jgi:hypothetical protein
MSQIGPKDNGLEAKSTLRDLTAGGAPILVSLQIHAQFVS